MLSPNVSRPLEILINTRQALKNAIFHSRQAWKLSLSGIVWALDEQEGSHVCDSSYFWGWVGGVSVATTCPGQQSLGHDGEAL